MQCHQCLHVAVDQNHLDTHIEVVHVGVKRFTCDQCKDRFSRSDNFKRHKKRVHGAEKNLELKCALCPYASTNEVEITSHLLKVHVSH